MHASASFRVFRRVSCKRVHAFCYLSNSEEVKFSLNLFLVKCDILRNWFQNVMIKNVFMVWHRLRLREGPAQYGIMPNGVHC